MEQDRSPQPEQIEPLLLTVRQAARRAGLGYHRMRELVNAGEIPTKTVCGQRYVPLHLLIAWANTTNGV